MIGVAETISAKINAREALATMKPAPGVLTLGYRWWPRPYPLIPADIILEYSVVSVMLF